MRQRDRWRVVPAVHTIGDAWAVDDQVRAVPAYTGAIEHGQTIPGGSRRDTARIKRRYQLEVVACTTRTAQSVWGNDWMRDHRDAPAVDSGVGLAV